MQSWPQVFFVISVSALGLAGFLSKYLDSFVEREAESTSSILSSIAAASVADFKTCSLTASGSIMFLSRMSATFISIYNINPHP
jgi:hypothetical protein